VETDRSWIEANFKETELAHLGAGQTVSIDVDSFPGLRLEGQVESLGAGTGAEFSLLPAQNATGNWVKVVQRVPVRIALSSASDMPPLRTGMSASVTVDTGRRTMLGALTSGITAWAAPSQTAEATGAE
jgi:membrane fusion protein (multidrug efflux system)